MLLQKQGILTFEDLGKVDWAAQASLFFFLAMDRTWQPACQWLQRCQRSVDLLRCEYRTQHASEGHFLGI